MQITHLNFAKGFRGGERQTQLLIEELSKNGYKQRLIVRKNSELTKRCINIKDLEIIEIAKPFLFNMMLVRKDTILHAHETKAAQFCYMAHLFFRVPYIITRRVDNKIKNNFFTKAMYDSAMYTAVLSSAIEAEVKKVSQSANIVKIPSAYSNLSVDKSSVEKIKERFREKFLIGNIGELDNSHKGQYYLIEAIKILSTKYPQIELVLLGKGKDEESYRLQASGYNNIIFEGFVANVGDYIESLDLFVFPSLNEGLGSILLDVMNAKIPIIATDVGGIPDIIENQKNGILINPKDINAIVEAIEDLYNDKQKAIRLAMNGYEQIDKFSASSMSKHYEHLYTTVAGGSI